MGSLGKRLFLLFSIITLICLLIMMIQGIHCSHRAVHNAAHAYLSSVVECKREHFELWLKERALDIKMLSETSCLTACCSKEFSNKGSFCSIFYSIQNRSNSFKRFSIYETTGEELFTTHKSTFHFAESKLFKIASDQLNQSPGLYWDYTSLPQIKVLCSINNNRQFMLVEMDITDTLQQLVHHNTTLGSSDKIIITNTTGKVLAGSINPSENTRLLVHQVVVSPVGIVIKSMIPTQEAMAEMYLYIQFAITTVLVTLLILFFVIWKISWNISKPILEIAATARKITKGDLKQRVKYQGKDEINTLIHDFNYMADCLVANQKSMEQKHQQLQNAYDKIEETKLQLVKIESLAATGKMAASIVHEIRNPLSTIKMNLQILTRALGKGSKYDEHGNIAAQQLQHLENMLTDLLNYSRPISLTKETCKLHKLVSIAIDMISAETTKHQVFIENNIPDITIHCDDEKLEQVIMNILLNSVQAFCTTIHISIQEYKAKVILCIKDNGKGISTENLENVFEPFFSLRKNGIGLGLSYAKKIIQLHGGTISVNSILKQGTCFELHLPHQPI